MAVKGGESKQGLIISLVLCVLTIIILGVACYYGFADKDVLEKNKKDAEAKVKDMTNDRDYYKMQALAWKAYAGGDMSDDEKQALPVALNNRATFASVKGGEGVLKDLDMLSKDLIWDDNKKMPLNTYKSQRNEARAERDTAKATLAQEKENNAKAVADLNATIKKKEDLLAQANLNIVAANKKGNDDLEQLNKQLLDSRTNLDDAGKKKGEEIKEFENQLATKDKTISQLNKQNKSLTTAVEEKDQKLAPYISQLDTLGKDQPKGKIVSIDSTGFMPFINLGSADNVKAGLTFAVYAVAPDGSPTKQRKGSLEVTRVVGDHLAQGRLTYAGETSRERDAARQKDPLIPGDLIYNPAWSSSLKQHVAVVGIIDLTAEGKTENAETQMRKLVEFMRNLETQNMIVDAYLDLKDLKIKGEINRQTDYLIQGELPDAGRGNKDTDPRAERHEAISRKMNEMNKQAQSNAVTGITLRKFMSVTGQRLPRGLEPEGPNYNFRSIVPSGSSPIERKDLQREGLEQGDKEKKEKDNK